MYLQIDYASLIVRGKFTVFALFYFVFEGNFPSTSPRGGLYLEGRFNGGFFALPVWGAYIWRALYMEGLIFGILRYASELQLTLTLQNPNPRATTEDGDEIGGKKLHSRQGTTESLL